MSPLQLSKLFSLQSDKIKFGLDNIRNLLERLGNPQDNQKIIHFAGTNGKGSTLITLEKLLIKSGFKTGSTISPHLISLNERYRINSEIINDQDLTFAFEQVKKVCILDDDLSPISKTSSLKPSFFEFSLAMAFVIFRLKKVDYILLETGLGGRLDATNIIKNPLACVITKIDIDHTEYLGNN